MSVNKIFLDPQTLLPHIEELKTRGLTIVFANGCFELLHAGHVRYLHSAKALGDVLIVAVNTDRSIQMIKRNHRPVNPDHERFEIIAALEAVDYVVPLREETPESLLRMFTPHFHTKGTDYTLDQIPERKVVEAYGGTVALVGGPKDHSTTEIVHTIRNQRR